MEELSGNLTSWQLLVHPADFGVDMAFGDPRTLFRPILNRLSVQDLHLVRRTDDLPPPCYDLFSPVCLKGYVLPEI